MRTITTKLSEKRFLSRLDSMCTQQKIFAQGYTGQDVFVVKRKQQRFRIGRHVSGAAMARYDGYLLEFVYGEYTVNGAGKVEVRYRFGKPLSLILPDILVCLVAMPIFACTVYDAVFNACYQWGGLLVTLILSAVSLIHLLAGSKKTRAILEAHLRKICSQEQ